MNLRETTIEISAFITGAAIGGLIWIIATTNPTANNPPAEETAPQIREVPCIEIPDLTVHNWGHYLDKNAGFLPPYRFLPYCLDSLLIPHAPEDTQPPQIKKEYPIIS